MDQLAKASDCLLAIITLPVSVDPDRTLARIEDNELVLNLPKTQRVPSDKQECELTKRKGTQTLRLV
jgi:hypothetical protein